MDFSETARVEKKIGFVSSSTKTGRVSSKDVKKKFETLFSKGESPKRSKYTIIDGIPYKSVDGKLVPLTSLK